MKSIKMFFKCGGFRTGNRYNLVLERSYVDARQRSRVHSDQRGDL